MNTTATPEGAGTPTTGELITLAGGCFWCLEAVYRQVRGVLDVECGYSNGWAADPDYDVVCSGTSGHAEVVQIRFDPAQVELATLLRIFFAIHDPTTPDRQGNDEGSQYRSGIYWHEQAQRAVIEWTLAQQAANFADPIVTEVAPLSNYSPAEAFHQRYFERHPSQGYCVVVIAPKLEHFRTDWANWLA